MATAIFVTCFVGILVFQVVASAGLLQGGLYLAKARASKFKLALFTAIGIWLLNFILLLIAAPSMMVFSNQAIKGLVLLVAFGTYLYLCLRLLRSRYAISRKQAFATWLAIQLVVIPNWLVSEFFVRPHVVEAFTEPLNSMAPTICGEHLEEKCPNCLGTLIVSASAVNSESDLGICANCLQTAYVPIRNHKLHDGDRVLVSKFLKPRRWDMIVFRYPDEPSVLYLKRLVGLPGETLSIHDGSVWISDKELTKPENLAGLSYIADLDRPKAGIFGPVTLASDESFVLGDFSARSKDSRFWEVGAPGHSPFAVPDTHLVGVVTHIYWPPSRWRVFR